MEGSGSGHLRRLTDGRLIWVRPHCGGLVHALYVPGVWAVESALGNRRPAD